MKGTDERHYRGKASHPIPVWNGLLEHLRPMGMAIWLYLWCLDRITRESDGIGHVLGGAPVKTERIAAELGRSPRALRRDFGRLRPRYLQLRWTPYGYVIEVLNSRKFGIWHPHGSAAQSGQAKTKIGRAVTENGRSKEDSAVAAVDAAADRAAASPRVKPEAWEVLGHTKPFGPFPWRRFWETSYASRQGTPLSEVMSAVADSWEATGSKVPAPFFRALAEIRKREKEHSAEATQEEPIKAFGSEEIPA